MVRYIVANWESHATLRTAEQWLRDFFHYFTPAPEVKVIIAPAFVFLHELKQHIAKQHYRQLALAAQDISPFPFGAYTGAVAAGMVRGMVEYAIVGHASRRRYFHETEQEIANKAGEAASAGITPILCLDPVHARKQLSALEENQLENLILAYTPLTVAGTDLAPSLQEAGRQVGQISALAPRLPLLYGGPVSVDTAAALLRLEGVAGLLVGAASLDPLDFANICAAAA